MAHLLPAGIFQPSSVLPAAVEADFSIWRNIQREYAEELLGHDEYDGSGRPIRYRELEPFVTMDHAMADGRLRVWCLGVTLDALTLCGDILTVAVVDPDLYDQLFGDAVDNNAEGSIPRHVVPFEANTLGRLRELSQLSPGAAAALHLAWHHRTTQGNVKITYCASVITLSNNPWNRIARYTSSPEGPSAEMTC